MYTVRNEDESLFYVNHNKTKNPFLNSDQANSMFNFVEKSSQSKKIEETAMDTNLAIFTKINEHPRFNSGYLLKSVESESLFPYIHYIVFDQKSSDDQASFDHQSSQHSAKSEFNWKLPPNSGLYEELSTMFPRKLIVNLDLPKTKDTGYFVFGFKTLTNEQRNLLENEWFEWTGAKQLYDYCPKSWNIKRMTFHKSSTDECIFDFVLICEFADVIHPDNILNGCCMVERLKLRYYGYVGLYKIHWFYKQPPIPEHIERRNLAIIEEESKDV